jgi:hypothetical protein
MSTYLASVSEGLGKFLGVKPINASEEDLEMLKKVLDSKVSDSGKTGKVKRVLGSYCIVCGALPTQIATYDYVGATRIERYCDSCVKSLEKQFAVFED